jgi:hypothetical protein
MDIGDVLQDGVVMRAPLSEDVFGVTGSES